MQDSWIDKDEFDELMGSFSSGKKKSKRIPTSRKSRSEKETSKETDASTPRAAPEESSDEALENDDVVFAEDKSAGEPTPLDGPSGEWLISEEDGQKDAEEKVLSSSKPEADGEEEKTEEMVNSDRDHIESVETKEAALEVKSETPDPGSEEKIGTGEHSHESAIVEAEAEAEAENEKEVETAAPVVIDIRNSEAKASIRPEPVVPARVSGERASHFLGDAADLLEDKDSEHSEQEAIRAVSSLAEARLRAEKSNLLRSSKETDLPAEEFKESAVETSRTEELPAANPIPQTLENPVSEPVSTPGVISDKKQIVVSRVTKAQPKVTVTVAEKPVALEDLDQSVAEEAPNPSGAVDAPTLEDDPETVALPEIDLNFVPSGSLNERMKQFASLVYREMGSLDVIIFDLDGYPLYESEQSRRNGTGFSPATLFNRIATVPFEVGFRRHTATQVAIGENLWHCLIPGWGLSAHVIARIVVTTPLDRAEVRAWSKALADAINPAHDSVSNQ